MTMLGEVSAALKAIPGAVKALARLVGAAGEAGAAWIDAGTAKGEQVATRIRGDTRATEELRNVLAKKAAEQSIADPTLVLRAVDRWSSDLLRKQDNREAVAVKTVQYLENDPPAPSTAGPAEDWMNVFEEYAERASSETLRQHWAHILAGEIRRPGTFSLMTLQFMSIMDQRLAATVEAACGTVMSGKYIPQIGKLGEGELYERLLLLQTLGFLTAGSMLHMDLDTKTGLAFFSFKAKALLLQGSPGSRFSVPCALLTPVGQEVLTFISYKDDEALIRDIGENIAPPSVQMGDWDGQHLTNLVRIKGEER